MEKVLIIGAGPAGLAAANAAVQQGLPCLVVEQSSQVGGLSRTIEHQGFRFDLGPHRFFTKNHQVQQLWEETLGEDFLAVPRLTRIYSQGNYFYYPLKLGNVLARLGPWASARAMVSYLRQRAWPDRADSYAGWVTRQFGRSLYAKFFKDHTAKVWGLPGDCLSPDWAAQRPLNLTVPALPSCETKLHYPVGAVDYIEQNSLSGTLLVSLNWGQYALWRLHPRVRVAPDGRYDTAYSAQVLAETFALKEAKPGWQDLLRAYSPDLILVDTRARLYSELLKQQEWREFYRDVGAALLGRAKDKEVTEPRLKRPGAASGAPPPAPAG